MLHVLWRKYCLVFSLLLCLEQLPEVAGRCQALSYKRGRHDKLTIQQIRQRRKLYVVKGWSGCKVQVRLRCGGQEEQSEDIWWTARGRQLWGEDGKSTAWEMWAGGWRQEAEDGGGMWVTRGADEHAVMRINWVRSWTESAASGGRRKTNVYIRSTILKYIVTSQSPE